MFDRVVEQGRVPRFVQRLKIVELDFDHEAPRFSNLRRRSTRKDSDLSALVDVRYTGAMRMLLVLEVGGGRWRLKVRHVLSLWNSKVCCAFVFPQLVLFFVLPFLGGSWLWMSITCYCLVDGRVVVVRVIKEAAEDEDCEASFLSLLHCVCTAVVLADVLVKCVSQSPTPHLLRFSSVIQI